MQLKKFSLRYLALSQLRILRPSPPPHLPSEIVKLFKRNLHTFQNILRRKKNVIENFFFNRKNKCPKIWTKDLKEKKIGYVLDNFKKKNFCFEKKNWKNVWNFFCRNFFFQIPFFLRVFFFLNKKKDFFLKSSETYSTYFFKSDGFFFLEMVF